MDQPVKDKAYWDRLHIESDKRPAVLQNWRPKKVDRAVACVKKFA